MPTFILRTVLPNPSHRAREDTAYYNRYKCIYEGQRLTFHRDRDDRRNKYAVVAVNESGEPCVKVSRGDSRILAPMLDEGKSLYCVVQSRKSDGLTAKVYEGD